MKCHKMNEYNNCCQLSRAKDYEPSQWISNDESLAWRRSASGERGKMGAKPSTADAGVPF